MVTYNSAIDRTGAQALMPEEVANTILQGLPQQSAALSMFRRVRMSRAQQRMPVLSALPIAYWVDGDTGLKQTSNISWDNKYLDARELAVIVPIPTNVLDDSAFDVWGEVRPRIQEAVGVAVDSATIFGINKPWTEESIVEGCIRTDNTRTIGDPLVDSNAVSADFSVELSETYTLVEEDGFDVAAILGPRRIKSRLRGLRATTGEPILAASVVANAPDTVYGDPIRYVSNGAWDPSYAAIVGDPNAAILGIRQDLTYQMFTEGVISDESGKVLLNLMQQDSVAMRVVMRLAFAVANPLNIQNPNANTRYPFAALLNEGS